MTFQFRCAALALGGAVLVAAPAAGQSAQQAPGDAQAIRQAIDDLKKDFDARLSALEQRLSAVETVTKGAQPPAAAPPAAEAAPQAAQQTTGAPGASVANAKGF